MIKISFEIRRDFWKIKTGFEFGRMSTEFDFDSNSYGLLKIQTGLDFGREEFWFVTPVLVNSSDYVSSAARPEVE